jgi:hypothetical protein
MTKRRAFVFLANILFVGSYSHLSLVIESFISMSANVQSQTAISDFRADLCTFIVEARQALTAIDMEARRAKGRPCQAGDSQRPDV